MRRPGKRAEDADRASLLRSGNRRTLSYVGASRQSQGLEIDGRDADMESLIAVRSRGALPRDRSPQSSASAHLLKKNEKTNSSPSIFNLRTRPRGGATNADLKAWSKNEDAHGGAITEDKPRTVWARNGVAVSACPKSVITGESLAFLEEYQSRQALRRFRSYQRPAGEDR